MPSESIVSIVHRSRVSGTPNEYTNQDISAIKNMIKEAIDYIGGLNAIVFPGARVLIKPNLVSASVPEAGITTDPRVIAAMIELIQDETKPHGISIGDEPHVDGAREAFKVSGIEEAVKRFDTELVYFDEEAHVEVNIPFAGALLRCEIPQSILDYDVIVNLPKLKTHIMTTVTLGMKNQWGLISLASRMTAHREDLHQAIVDLLRVVKPNLTLIDGIVAMEGSGPARGDLIQDMNVIIAGKDVVATDAVACAVMGIDPMDVRMIRIAHAEGLGIGDLEKIEIRGDKIGYVRRQFKKPDWEIRGIYPNVVSYVGGACMGCMSWVLSGLQYLDAIGLLRRVKKLTIIVGRKANVPNTIGTEQPTFVVGDCAIDHKEKGFYVQGCPPWHFGSLAEEECKKHVEG